MIGLQEEVNMTSSCTRFMENDYCPAKEYV
jgi:hypothetical protein